MANPSFRILPKEVVPINYDIVLTPNFDDFTFKGVQTIDVKVNQETSEIVMNAAEVTVTQGAWHDKANGTEQRASTIEYNVWSQETVTLKFDTPLRNGSTGSLRMEFSGIVNDKLKGFYRSKFKGPDGQDRYNFACQFAPVDARRCFPSWDEPALKATFDVSLVVDKNKVAVSNMPVKSVIPVPSDPSLHTVAFQKSPIMSSYLVAFIIGDFEYVETKSTDGVLCRVYTPLEKAEQGKFALDVASKVLPYYKDYFGIPYPLDKLDLAAIADFALGAMENWGLILYRESCLLIDEKLSSATNRQRVALIVAHEIAHQWFGNLVTMKDWSDLWLNEGYATFTQFLATDILFPEFDVWSQFVSGYYCRALELDSLENSHPIEVPVNNPSEIDEIFDEISYDKGASIIRMLYNYIGEADFRKGMHLYLTRYQYNNACTNDLWAALGEASGKPIEAVMGTWTRQMGFPLVRVLASRQVGTDRVIELSQEKFCMDPSKVDSKYHWMIPLTFCSASNPKGAIYSTLMESKTLTVTIPNVAENEWVKLNPAAIGFFRVQYSVENLEQFLPAIQQKLLPPLDRLNLLDDLFALVLTGQSSTTSVLKILQAFKEEDNYTVWSSINSILTKLHSLIQYTDSNEQFKVYGRSILSVIEEKMGWEAKPNESHLQTMLRPLILNRLVSFEHEKTLEESKKRFKSHLLGENPVVADLRSVVYRGVISLDNEETLDALLKLYRETEMHEEKERIGRSLGALKSSHLLKKALEFSISDDVRTQDSVSVIVFICMSKTGREVAWQFFKDNKKTFQERYPGGYLIPRLVKYLTEGFVTEEVAADVEKFFAENSFPATERTVQQSLESIRINAAWLKRDEKNIQEYLQNVCA